MEVEDFIPFYPSISSSDFNSKIYTKKEFRSFYKDTSLLPHQQLVGRYVSSYTMYNGVLVFHEMGTGKTCTAVGAIEQIFAESRTIKRALIITKGQSLIDNFINEIVNVCAKETYGHLSGDARVRSKLKPNYEFTTYEIFSKQVAQHPSNYYENTVIVIDEAHNLLTEKKEEYSAIHAFLHSLKNTKVLLMSGTPMRDQPSDIADIMNLILPLDEQMPTGKEFMEHFFRGRNIQDSDQLKKYFTGRVSYIKSNISDVKKVYEGEHLGTLKEFIVFPTTMSQFQSKTYVPKMRAEKDFYIAARQAALFVFPDGTSGSEGFKKYVQKTERRSKLGESKNEYSIKSTEFKTQLRDPAMLRQYSAKYAFLIEKILANPRKLFFVYGEFVEGSGIVLFSKILEEYGFSKSGGKESTKAPRYAIISNLTTSLKRTRSILKLFNGSDNKYGEYIQVIIGSRVISEGFTLKNISQAHILTPHWNYSDIDQTVARAFRTFSHDALIADGVSPVLEIYQHVSLPSSKEQNMSIDLKMYEVSEQKDVLIKHIERIAKESAFDCQSMYTRNRIYGHDGQRVCDYQSCNYSCGIVDLPENSDTYNIYYAKEDIQAEMNTLTEDLKFSAVEHSDPPSIVVRAVSQIGSIVNPRGAVGYPHIDRDKVYASLDMYDDGDSGNGFYFLNPAIKTDLTFADVSTEYVYAKRVPLLLEDIRIAPSGDLLRELPLDVQEMLLEQSFFAGDSHVAQFVRKFYKQYMYKIGRTEVSTLLYTSQDTMRCFNGTAWSTCPPSIKQEVVNEMQDIEKRARGVGYYGIVSKDKFLIKIVSEGEAAADKRLAPRGRACATLDKGDLMAIAQKIGVELDTDLGKKELCADLQQWFIENNLVIYQ